MASRALPRKRKSRNPSRWLAWWPLLVGILATPFAVRTAEILPLMGIAGLHRMCLLYPFTMLVQQHPLGLPEHTTQILAQACLYTQFPLYGLLIVAISRSKTLAAALITILCLHLAAAATAWASVAL